MKHAHRSVAGLVIALLLAAAPGQAQAKPETTKKVNINSADSSQLSMLPRVGPSVADRIVEYRKENGPFKKPEDLMLVQGIGEKTFQLIKPYLATSGETTLNEKVGNSRGGSGKAGKGKSGRSKSGKPAKAAKEKSAPDGSIARGGRAAHAARAAAGRSVKKAAKPRSTRRKSGAGVR
ncbi:MAG TPA: helix-hairpin-helix domain-containing protein [Thermoanaerobaculia bacterium]|nr:helix-hairpin-helix domain-containing protein [Thermoanaerobaculia bacterium]